MVISTADGGPEDGRENGFGDGQNEGLPINPANWRDHAEGEIGAATDRAGQIGEDMSADMRARAAEFGEDASVAAAAGADQMFGTSLNQTDRLALGDEERLPWLESADDADLDDPASDNGRMIGFAAFAVLLLAALVGGLYWLSHRSAGPAAADGSVIAASTEPYKVAPKEPGGKTFDGTGDASFKVSEGEKPVANLAGSGAGAPKPGASSPAAGAATGAGAGAAAAPANAASGVGVQIGAFSSSAGAEAAWSKLAAAHPPLAGLAHRVVEGKADMATVFRLQAVAGDVAGANALCAKLQAGGLKCQVKR